MTRDQMDESVRTFILQKIDSVTELETLLLLFKNSAGQNWTSHAVTQELRGAETASKDILVSLARKLLIREESPGNYRFANMDPDLSELVKKLMETYAERRVSVIHLIYNKPSERIRDLANAFKVRKEE